MRFGHFDDRHREYVITRPDMPLPWINYLGMESYSFYQDALLRRLTRYRYNNVPLDVGGRYLYLRDNASGEFWSPTWMPTRKTFEAYNCRHGMGDTRIDSAYQDVRVEVCFFVPPGATLEVWGVRCQFRGASYEIRVQNPDHVSKGVNSVSVDGVVQKGNLLSCSIDGKTHLVEVTLG